MRNFLDIGEYCAELGRRASKGESAIPKRRIILDASDYKDPAGRGLEGEPIPPCPQMSSATDGAGCRSHMRAHARMALRAKMRMIGWQFGMLMGNDVRVRGRPEPEREQHAAKSHGCR